MRRLGVVGGLVLVLGGLMLAGLGIGSSEVGFEAVGAWLSGEALDAATRAVLVEIRLARVLLAVIVGISLAAGGTVYQAVLRNPLAEPYLLGISGGAVLGALCHARWPLGGMGAGFLMAFLGALTTSGLVFLIGGRARGGPTRLLLAGVMVNTLCSALLVLLLALSNEPSSQAVFFWLLGDLSRADLSHALLLGGVSLPLWGLLALGAHRLNLHALGDAQATSLGVAVVRERRLLLALAGLATAIAVALAGLVGFVGLMAPPLARALVGSDYRRLLPVSMLLGAVLLLLADMAARSLFAPTELPVGVFTAIWGVPFFLVWMTRRDHAA